MVHEVSSSKKEGVQTVQPEKKDSIQAQMVQKEKALVEPFVAMVLHHKRL